MFELSTYENETLDELVAEFYEMPTIDNKIIETRDILPLPKQLPKNAISKAIVDASPQLNGFLLLVFGVTFLINCAANNDMTLSQLILTLFIQQFSLIVHLPILIRARVPAILQEVFKYLLPFVMFDVANLAQELDENYTVEYVLSLQDEETNSKIRPNVRSLGYESVNCVVSLGTMWLVSCLFLARVALLFLYKVCTCGLKTHQSSEFCVRERSRLFWSEFISLFIEGLLEFFVVSYLHFRAESFVASGWSLAFVIVYLVSSLIILPALAVHVLCCKPLEELRQKENEEKYGPLYFKVKLKNRWTATYFIEHSLRRGLYAIIMFNIGDAALQAISISLLNIAHLIYAGNLRARTEPLLNKIELANEWFIQMITMHFFFFIGDTSCRSQDD